MDIHNVPAALAEVVQGITAAGVEAVLDPRMANPPCAVVQFDSIDRLTFCGDVTPKAVIYLVAPDNGLPDALNELFAMAGKLPAAYTQSVTSDVVPVGGTAPLPALRLGPIEIGD